MKYIQGDLFDFVTPNTVIPHVCNNQNTWGRGFVVPLMEHYLTARNANDEWFHKGYWVDVDHDNHSYCIVPHELGRTQLINVDTNVYVANMIAQVFYVRDGSIRQYRPLYYNKLADCMEMVAIFCKKEKLKILAPMFGSELAGGDWKFIECLIEDIWEGLDVTIVEYKK